MGVRFDVAVFLVAVVRQEALCPPIGQRNARCRQHERAQTTPPDTR